MMKRLVFLIVTVFWAGGCTTVSKTPPKPVPPMVTAPKQEGIYHKVQKGETIWRIAKTYNVLLEDIIKSNNIPNAALIEENQLVFIPGAIEIKKIILRNSNINKDEFAWPIRGKILAFFNESKGSHVNRGIDIQANGAEIVKAAREGNVVFADYLNGYGQTIILDHLDGYCSVYSLNTKLLVKLGDHVYKGDPIGQIGENQRMAFLHFEVRKNRDADNPLYYLP